MYDWDCHSHTRSCPSFCAPNANHWPVVLIATEVIFSLDIDKVWTLVIDEPWALDLKDCQQ
jgi:hypothetical protein